MLNKQYYVEKAKVDRLVARKNTKADFYNGIYVLDKLTYYSYSRNVLYLIFQFFYPDIFSLSFFHNT